MATFSARLALAEDRGSEVGAEISLDDQRIRITANGEVIGDWAFEEVEIFNFGDGLHLFVEGEEVVVACEEPEFFPAMLEAAVVGPVRLPVGGENLSARAVTAEDGESRSLPDESDTGSRTTGVRRRRRGAHEAEFDTTPY